MGLQAVDSFVAKCIQLYETTLVRHGLMLVGPTMGGKTVCYRVLQKVWPVGFDTTLMFASCGKIPNFCWIEPKVIDPVADSLKLDMAGQHQNVYQAYPLPLQNTPTPLPPHVELHAV